MSNWDYDDGGVRNAVDIDTIRKLVRDGTLTAESKIRRFGTEDWTTIEAQFPRMLHKDVEVTDLKSGNVLPNVVSGGRGKDLRLIFGVFCVVAGPGVVVALFNMLPSAPPLLAVASENTLEHACSLLVFVVLAIVFGLTAIDRRLRNTAEIIRAAEIAKLGELAEIRRLLAER